MLFVFVVFFFVKKEAECTTHLIQEPKIAKMCYLVERVRPPFVVGVVVRCNLAMAALCSGKRRSTTIFLSGCSGGGRQSLNSQH